jgi:hypothetical protein
VIENGGFEQEWVDNHTVTIYPVDGAPYEAERGNIFVLPGWEVWFKHKAGTWDQPEVTDIWASAYDYRVRSGQKAQKFFTTGRRHDGGYRQQINVNAGQKIRVTAWGHAWSNHHDPDLFYCYECWEPVRFNPDQEFTACPNCDTPLSRQVLHDANRYVFPHPNDGKWSEGTGIGYNIVALNPSEIPEMSGDPQNDAIGNIMLSVGIDPTGNTNPFASTVVWNSKAIYNGYKESITVEAVAQSETITIFLRSTTLYAFKHNDVYWDDVSAEVVDESPLPPTEWDYDVVETGSKLSVHTINTDGVPGFAQTLKDNGIGFAVIKGVDNLGWLVDAKQNYPDSTIVARLVHDYERCPDVHFPETDLDNLADNIFSAITDACDATNGLKEAVDYWEPINEPDPPGTDGYRRLSELQFKLMDRAEDYGVKIAIFTLNAGTPEWDEAQAMVETGVFGRAKQGGHILALHEGVFSPYDPVDTWWGDDIPGVPDGLGEEIGAGALCFRYRYLYHLLQERNEVIPLVVSEWCGYDQGPLTPDDVLQRVEWYDTKMREDYWAWGFCPFTLGPTSGWTSHDYEFAYQTIVDYMISIKDEQNGLPTEDPAPPEEYWGFPREQYSRTYVLMPPGLGVDWYIQAQIGGFEKRLTVGSSADDAGIGYLDDKTVLAINPDLWTDDLQAFFTKHYPHTTYRVVNASTPEELALKLMPSSDGDLTVSQNNPLWANDDLGEEPGGETIGEAGCLLSVACMILRKVYNRNIIPPILNKSLEQSGNAFFEDDLLSWNDAISKYPAFDNSAKINSSFAISDLAQMQDDGWEIGLRVSGGSHFVYLEYATDQLHVIDPWDGERKTWDINDVSGIRAAHVAGGEPKPPSDLNVIGVHGSPILSPPPREDWGFWISEMKVMGVKLYKVLDSGGADNIDWVNRLMENGIEPIVRVFCAQQFPSRLPRGLMDRAKQLIDAGVKKLEIGNEPNLPGEWQSKFRDRVDWHNSDLVALVAENWWMDAKEITDHGGQIAFMAMAPTDRGGTNSKYSSVKWYKGIAQHIANNHRNEAQTLIGSGKLWVAVHISPFNRTLDFSPFRDGYIDDMCLRAYEAYNKIYHETLGIQPIVISTEGGAYSPEHLDDLGWDAYTEEYWAQLAVSMYQYLAEHNGPPVCSWVLTDQGVDDPRWRDNGWYRGKSPRLIVQTMKEA